MLPDSEKPGLSRWNFVAIVMKILELRDFLSSSGFEPPYRLPGGCYATITLSRFGRRKATVLIRGKTLVNPW